MLKSTKWDLLVPNCHLRTVRVEWLDPHLTDLLNQVLAIKLALVEVESRFGLTIVPKQIPVLFGLSPFQLLSDLDHIFHDLPDNFRLRSESSALLYNFLN